MQLRHGAPASPVVVTAADVRRSSPLKRQEHAACGRRASAGGRTCAIPVGLRLVVADADGRFSHPQWYHVTHSPFTTYKQHLQQGIAQYNVQLRVQKGLYVCLMCINSKACF